VLVGLFVAVIVLTGLVSSMKKMGVFDELKAARWNLTCVVFGPS